MLDLLIKKNEYNQLLILGSALSNYTVSKKTLESSLNLTHVTLSRYLRNINADLREIYPQQKSVLKVSGDRFIFTQTDDQPDYDVFHQLLQKFLKGSTIFQTLKSLLLKNIQKTDLLIEELNISQSYFNKIVKEINRYFETCQVQIIQRNKHIFFVGKETHILYLEYLTRQYINKFTKLPCECTHYFPELIEVIRDHNISDLNDIQLNRVKELHHIFKKRSEKLSQITLDDPELKEILLLIVQENDLLTDDIDFSNDTRLFANLLARFSSSQLEDTHMKSHIGKKLSQSPTILTKDCLAFIDIISAQFSTSLDKTADRYFEFVYMAHLHFIYIRLFGTDFKKQFTLKHADIFQTTCKNQDIYYQLMTSLEDQALFNTLHPLNQEMILKNNSLFVDASYTAIRTYLKTSVTISFDFIYRLSFEFFIQQQLREIFTESSVIFTYNSELADIVVTDHLVPVKKNSKLFPFIDTNSEKSLEKLLALITTVYSKKTLSKNIDYLNI